MDIIKIYYKNYLNKPIFLLFKLFLCYNNAYEFYLTNFSQEEKNAYHSRSFGQNEESEFINRSFYWDNTAQGQSYWYALHQEWNSLVRKFRSLPSSSKRKKFKMLELIINNKHYHQ